MGNNRGTHDGDIAEIEFVKKFNINKNEFSNDNTKLYCTGDNVNIRTGPSTSYEVITSVNKQYKMTRILKGRQSGDKWDKVVLENGIVRIYLSNLCYRNTTCTN